MSLDIGAPSQKQLELREKILSESFNSGSPYFDMFRCGVYGVPIDDCLSKCGRNQIAIRQKDIKNWESGYYRREIQYTDPGGVTNLAPTTYTGVPIDEARLTDFPLLPQGWNGTKYRFFPCSEDNKPLIKWGYSADYTPTLYLQEEARSLSPVHWVGQNMLYQPFVVIDIDGVGHGEVDKETISFGRMFSEETFTMEDPNKKGSFHLYFATNRLLPVRHFGWAKIDFMGNAVNAAVYLKNKVSNNKPLMQMTEEIWNLIQTYQKTRKEELCR